MILPAMHGRASCWPVVRVALAGRRYLMGDRQMLADWRLFTTLVRFDTVYHSHFKCNLRRIADYPSLQPYLRDLYQEPGVAETVDFDHIKRHYHGTHESINPTGIIPAGRSSTSRRPTAAVSLRGVEISTDRDRIDRELVHRFLSEHSYWAGLRTREQNDRIIDASLCFGAFDKDGRQIAHARVVGDGVAFGYLGDVFVVPEARGRGVGKALIEAVLAHPHVRDLKRLALVTDDAHGLYEQYGFEPLDDGRKWMQRRR